MQKLFLLFIGLVSANAICFSQENVIVTGTLTNFFLKSEKDGLSMPFQMRNPKAYSAKAFEPQFISTDSFYYKLKITEPGIYNILLNDVYLIPGDSVHIDYYFEDENKVLKDSFTAVYSQSGFPGNIGYNNYIKRRKKELKQQINSTSDVGIKLNRIDSYYTQIAREASNYKKHMNISNDYWKIISEDLAFECFTMKMDEFEDDTTEVLKLINQNSVLFKDDTENTGSFFLALGSIPETLFRLYHEPTIVVQKIRESLKGETYNYASLILAKILDFNYPSSNNPYTKQLAKQALENTRDSDLMYLANSILNSTKAKNIDSLFKTIQVANYYGKETTIGNILQKATGKLKYVDFWASWCGPCIVGLPLTMSLSSSYGKDKISAVIISIDEDKQSWMEASKKLQLDGNASYHVIDQRNREKLRQLLDLVFIPRYLLVDSENTIQLLNAPGAKNIKKDFIERYLGEEKEDNRAGGSLMPPPPRSRP